MNPAEIVVHIVERDGRCVVLDLLRERVRASPTTAPFSLLFIPPPPNLLSVVNSRLWK